MTTWTFPVDEQDWSLDDNGGCNTVEWDGTEGRSGNGSIYMQSGALECSEMGMSKTISPSRTGITDFSFWYKYNNVSAGDTTLTFRVNYDDATNTDDTVTLSDGVSSGWLEGTLTLNAAKNVDEIVFSCETPAGSDPELWIDDVYLENADVYALTHSAEGIPGSILV